MTTKRILIFSGGTLGTWALDYIRELDILVGADRGALFLVEHGWRPHMSLGDFDSVIPEQLNKIKAASLDIQTWDPIHKDWTDTELALRWAIGQQPSEIILLGVLGTRFDHTLANVHLLRVALAHGIPCRIADAMNILQLVEQELVITRNETGDAFNTVSLLPLSLDVHGITLQGFRYPLQDASLTLGQSLGISNVLESDVGRIRIASGLLLVIRSCENE
ncbi:thiamine diphosphokinase [Paenibacillus sp. y28]|uniref:thiamine diphosphokinase n=1 Tax=Paenibacillus sp. y28 TaxID=3129110 RepID=UPI003018A4AF